MTDNENTNDVELTPINLADVNLTDEEVEYSAEDDAFSQSAPVPDDEYLCKLTLGTGPDQKVPGPLVAKSKRGTEYHVPIEVKIAEGPFKDAVLFYTAKTTIQRGKKTCTAAGLIAELNYKVEAKTSKLKLVKTLVAALKKEPSVYVTTEWGAWDKTAGRNGMMVRRGMKNFPIGDDGKPMHEFLNVNTNNTVSAKARPVRFRSVKKGATPKSAPAQPKTTAAASGADEILPELE